MIRPNIHPHAVTLARCAALAVLIALGWAAPAVAQAERPNIIFIMTDDHANEAVSAYSGRINQTPHMDRLAEQGMIGADTAVAFDGVPAGLAW